MSGKGRGERAVDVLLGRGVRLVARRSHARKVGSGHASMPVVRGRK
jgi:hypothetical protein